MPKKTPFVTSVIFLPSVISSDSITFLVFFLFGALGERLVVDLMLWGAPGGRGAGLEVGGDVGLCTEAKQDRRVNILFRLISNFHCVKHECTWGDAGKIRGRQDLAQR